MNNQVNIFNFESNKPMRLIKDGDSFHVVAKDVVEAIGAQWNGSAAIANVPDEWKGVRSVLTQAGKRDLLTLSEAGLYFYLGRSDKPKALPFQKWLAGDVLPSIRKTGSYSISPTPPTDEIWVGVTVASRQTGVCERTILRRIANGALPRIETLPAGGWRKIGLNSLNRHFHFIVNKLEKQHTVLHREKNEKGGFLPIAVLARTRSFL